MNKSRHPHTALRWTREEKERKAIGDMEKDG
jgi:hypothetical protein